MSKSNFLENGYLGLIFNGTAIANLAQNDTSTPKASLYLSLHTGDPGEAGTQATNECAYGAYARVTVTRGTSGFTVSSNQVTLAANADFPQATSGTETATYFAVGTASTGTGAILYSGTISPNISISTGVTPRLTTGTTITED